MARKLLIIFLLLSSGCSVQKRHFTKGYDVQWKGTYASSSNAYTEAEPLISEPCDTIKKKDGSVVLAIVERIDSKKIYITPCENSDNSNNEVDRTNVSSIHYANGALFENKTPEQLQKERETNLEKYRQELAQREQLEKTAEKSSKTLNNIPDESTDPLGNPNKKEPNKVKSDPTLLIFYLSAFGLVFLTLLMAAFGTFKFIASGIILLLVIALFVSSLMVAINYLTSRHRNRVRRKWRLIFLELLFGILSFVDIFQWVDIWWPF